MKRTRAVTATILASAALGGCGAWEHASVTVAYGTGSAEWSLNEHMRKRVENAFRVFSEQNGYACHQDIKRVWDRTCRGPKDLYLEFKRSLNKPEFVAEFSWVDYSDRSHEEFLQHVSKLETALAAEVGNANVHVD